jgi:DNA adenine methylase
LNGELMNFWRVLQGEESFNRFQRIVEATPFSQPQWEQARTAPRHELDIQAAVAFFVKCRQSFAGGFKGFAPLSKNRTRRGMSEQASAWLNCVDGLANVHDRLKRVVVLCDDALKVIKQCKGSVMLSGYLNELYDQTLGGWKRHDMKIDNKVSGAGKKREMTECLWCNF